MTKDKRQAALDYHALPTPGKIAVVPTKPARPSTTSRSPIRRAWPSQCPRKYCAPTASNAWNTARNTLSPSPSTRA